MSHETTTPEERRAYRAKFKERWRALIQIQSEAQAVPENERTTYIREKWQKKFREMEAADAR